MTQFSSNRWNAVFLCVGILMYVGMRDVQAQDTRLVEAVKLQDRVAVDAFLTDQVDANIAQPDGATALHWASYHDDLGLVELLLDAGAKIDAVNDYGITPLSLACENGAATMVSRLIAAGASPDITRSTGETPLMTCARTGSVEAVTALLTQGADPNASESWQGQTALMWAAAEAHTGVVRALIDHGATISARSTNGYTAILIAARENTPKLTQSLLEAGADVNDASPDGMTPLLVATVRGHAELVLDLLERGADPNASGPGYTALHWVSGAWHTELTGNLQGIDVGREKEWLSLNEFSDDRKVTVVEALLQHGANVNVRLERKPPQYGFASGRFRVGLIGATPFWLAAMDGNVALMRMLSEAGADATLGTDEETSPLMVAAGLGQVPAETRVMPEESLAAVEFALSLGANVNRLNAVGRGALHGAAHIRSDEIVQVLVDHGAAVNAADQRGITPLMIAEGGGHILLPGLGGGSTADLLRALGGTEARPEDFIDSYREGPIR